MARRARLKSGNNSPNLALIILGIIALVLAGILVFVPFEGPIGEIVFGLVGIALLAGGVTSSR